MSQPNFDYTQAQNAARTFLQNLDDDQWKRGGIERKVIESWDLRWQTVEFMRVAHITSRIDRTVVHEVTGIPQTREAIERLMLNWSNDPCWDLSLTERFEAHKQELAAYQAKKELEWQQDAEQKLRRAAHDLGLLTDSQVFFKLVKKLMALEDRIKVLEAKVEAQ